MKILAKNKRAYFDYDIEQTYDAGLVLSWHEVKACKIDHCTITEWIIRYDEKQRSLLLINMDIPLYSKTQQSLVPGYIPKHPRQLLLNQREITRLVASTKKTGLTLVPLELFEASNRRIKIKIGLAKLRKKIEKKQILKEKDIEKAIRRNGER